MATATARACANIALVKYWGKRDARLNLPAAGSLSLTLDALVTTTEVSFDPALTSDELILDGAPAKPAERARTAEFLSLVRDGEPLYARVASRNAFPTASGLASSASGYAALATAAFVAHAATVAALSGDAWDAATALARGNERIERARRELSILARQGSGSAARSLYGGFVRMHAGEDATGRDAYAAPIDSTLVDRVRMVIAIVGGGAPKTHGSRDAMDHTAATSPLYDAWLALVPRDLAAAEAALAAGDIEALGAITEGNALAMHASAIAARPAVIYWQPATLAALAAVRALRAAGKAAWGTMDAGPHVKVLTTTDDAEAVAAAMRAVPGVTEVSIAAAGSPATLIAVSPQQEESRGI